MKKILFIASPGVTLFQPKVYQELSWGSVLVAGALEHHGFDVSFYDLNVALCKIRTDARLDKYEEKVLTDLEYLNLEMCSPGRATLLQEWIKKLLARIDLDKKYDAIGLSLGFTGWGTSSARGTLNFSLMLAAELKKRIPVPIFVGGSEILRDVGSEYQSEIFQKLLNCPVQAFFLRKGHEIFPKLLKEYFNGHGDLFEGKKYIDGNSSFKSSNVLPKYNIENAADLFISGTSLFPKEIMDKYPVMYDQDPITIVPWRHAMGCPYKCHFCDMGLDPLLRIHSVDDIVHSLSKAKEKGFVNFRWFNDNLNIGPKFPDQLADKIIEADLGIFFSDSANLQHTSLPLFQKLRKAGCIKLWYGTETMSERMLKLINKGHDLNDVYNTLNYGNNADIWNSLNIILSFPHEKEEDFNCTYDFLTKRKDLYDCFDMNIYRLLTGTSFEKFPEKHQIKIITTSMDNRMSAFDEIGGMSWNDRVEDSARKYQKIADINTEDKKMLLMNDYIYFYLKRCGFLKPQVKSIIEEVWQHYSERGNTQYLANYIERNIDETRRIELGDNIQGRLYIRPIGDRENNSSIAGAALM